MAKRDSIELFAASRGLPPLELRAGLHLHARPKDKPSAVALGFADGKAWVVRSHDGITGSCFPLPSASELNLERGRFRDTLLVDGARYETDLGSAKNAREIIALGRLCAQPISNSQPVHRARHIEPVTRMAKAWLQRWLSPNEHLLAWLSVRSPLPSKDDLAPRDASRGYFVLTEERAALVRLSELGDVELRIEPRAPLRIEQAKDRIWVRVGKDEWSIRGKSSQWFTELADVTALLPQERLREVARINWRTLPTEHSDFVLSALRHAGNLGDLLARLTELLLALESAEALADSRLLELVRKLNGSTLLPETLADLWQSWNISKTSGLGFVRLLRMHHAEPWALKLHQRIHRASPSVPAMEKLADDVQLAEHLLAETEASLAAELLAPHELDHDGNTGFVDAPSAEEVLRTRAYETLATARSQGARPDVRSLKKLVELRPLDETRAQRLADAAPLDLQERAAQVLALLQPGGVWACSPSLPHLLDVPLEARLIAEVVRHPLVRRSSDVLTALKAIVADVPMPDRSHLTDFCQKLNEADFPDAARALHEASVVLGVTELSGFVSRGDQAVGIRAFESAPPFVLLGGRHLDPRDPSFMDLPELRFALGAELAHLRLGHTRVTTSEFWAGALMKTGEGVELALSILPALKGWRLAGRLHHALGKLPPGALQRVASSAAAAGRALGSTPPASRALAPLNEELLEATRMLQLSADRAGLILCRDLPAAIRSILRVRRDYFPLLDQARHARLAELLTSTTTQSKESKTGDLYLRIGSLVAFYLSDHYARLCSELTTATAKHA